MENDKQILLAKEIAEKALVTHKDSFIYSTPGGGDAWMFDFRKIILTPAVLNTYTELFFERFGDKYPFQVGGIEAASIPLISAIIMKSVERGTPVNGFFIRKSRKKSGLLNMVEGNITDDPIILVDDLMNSGGSFIRQVEVLEKIELKNLSILAVFSILQFRKIEDYHYFKEKNIAIEKIFSLADFQKLLPASPPVDNILKQRIDNQFETKWIWRGESPSLEQVSPKSSPIFDIDKLYFGTDDGYFKCLNSKTGELIWDYKLPFGSKRRGQFSNPTIAGDIVIFGCYDGNVYAFDTNTGERKWVSFEGDWIETSPALAPKLDLIFIVLEFGVFKKTSTLVALSAADGRKKWQFNPPEKTSFSSPSYSSKHDLVLCGTADGNLFALKAKTGQLIWKTKTNCKIINAPCLEDNLGLVIINGSSVLENSEEKANLTVLDIKTGEIKFVYTDFYYGSYGTPVVYQDKIIFTSLDKHIYAINLITGKKIWTVDTGARIFAAPVLHKLAGKINLYVGSNNSVLHEIDPDTCIVTSMTYVTERITSKIAFDEVSETIFLPTYANELYALKRKAR